MNLGEIKEEAAKCKLCDLHKGRENPVFDKGNSKASIMICGMVPGPDENKVGVPFVGRAGKLLDKILNTIPMPLNKVYITNLVKCFWYPGRPLDQRWIRTCFPYLICQIEAIKPRVIVTLGTDASITLLGLDNDVRMGSIRGRIFDWSADIKVVPTYHPSYILRRGNIGSEEYQKVLNDFLLAKSIAEDK
jgi:DNA polymerase